MKHDDEIRRIMEEDEAFAHDALQKRPVSAPSEKVRQVVMQAARQQAARRDKKMRHEADPIPARPVRLKKVLQWGLAAAAVVVLVVLLRKTPEIRSPEKAEQPPPARSVVASNGVPRLTELDNRIDSVRTRMKNLRAAPRSSYGEQETAKLLKRTLRLKARVDEMSS